MSVSRNSGAATQAGAGARGGVGLKPREVAHEVRASELESPRIWVLQKELTGWFER